MGEVLSPSACLSSKVIEGSRLKSHVEVTAPGSLRENSCDKFAVGLVKRGTQGHCEPMPAAGHLSGRGGRGHHRTF